MFARRLNSIIMNRNKTNSKGKNLISICLNYTYYEHLILYKSILPRLYDITIQTGRRGVVDFIIEEMGIEHSDRNVITTRERLDRFMYTVYTFCGKVLSIMYIGKF